MYNKDDVLKQADNIANKIKNLDTIKTYQQIEAQIHQNQTIKTKMDMLKKHQKQAVNFQNYGKQNALEQSEHTIQSIEAEINTLPIVEQFQTSQYEANQLLKMFVSTMETRLNDHIKPSIVINYKQKGEQSYEIKKTGYNCTFNCNKCCIKQYYHHSSRTS